MRPLSKAIVPCLVALVFCVPLFRNLDGVDQENDEAIYSYAVESILETGDWMNPRSSPTADQVFLEKPPLKFWVVALPIRLGLLADDDVGLRFWDPVFGSLAFLYMFSLARRMGGWLAGVVGLLVMYTLEQLIFSHGLRGNNMEAALCLAYAGGVYHYLRWSEVDRPAWARAHAAAVGACFLLAFMTKFVAAAFLPAVIGAASLELPAVRAKVVREWSTWLVVAAGVVVAASPWFVYQSLQPGHAVWSVMFGEHVMTRFRASLDPSHLHPWYYYFLSLGLGLVKEGTVWLVGPGALLVHRRVLREPWPAGMLVLYWFWLPFAAMSLGSSKIWHYAYPFLAPVGLAAGYGVSRLAIVAVDVVEKLTGRTRVRRLARIAVPLLLLSVMPIPAYRAAVQRTAVQHHPMRSTRDCVREVRHAEQAVGRPPRDMAVYLPARTFNHSYFYYFRTLGWDRRDALPDAQLARLLDDPAEQRPVLLPADLFVAFVRANDPPGTVRPRVLVSEDMAVALPGPYGRCAF